jgi:hypothetical protein
MRTKQEQAHLPVLEVWYNDMMKQPAKQADRINAFLGGQLNIAAMVETVDETLYMNRA